MDTSQLKVLSITLQDYKSTMAQHEKKSSKKFNIKPQGFSKIGYGRSKTSCNDSYCMYEDSNKEYFAVYDGHGSKGKDFSQEANDYIQTYAEKQPKHFQFNNLKDAQRTFTQVFKHTQIKLEDNLKKYTESGTCALIMVHQKNHCYIANLGHSKVVLYRQVDDQLVGIELTQDHRPSRKDESDRIQANGGIIQGKLVDGIPTGEPRVYLPELKHEMKVTRSFGDFEAKKIGVIHEPEITDIKLSDQDEFIVMATDGIWDVMSVVEVGEFMISNKKVTGFFGVQEDLIQHARNKWDENNEQLNEVSLKHRRPYTIGGCDDITSVIVML